jgi:hypothetical protein
MVTITRERIRIVRKKTGVEIGMEHRRRYLAKNKLPEKKTQLTKVQNEILECVQDLGSVKIALEKHGVTWEQYYEWVKKNRLFKNVINKAMRVKNFKLCESLREEIYQRSIVGWEEPVFYQGVRTDVKLVKSDSLLALAAKANLPEYRQSGTEVTVNVQLNVAIEFVKTHVLPIIREVCDEDQVAEIRSRLNKAVTVGRG